MRTGHWREEFTVAAMAARLDCWAEYEWRDGCQLESLADLTPLVVTTAHSVYDIIVLSGRERAVMVCGGQFFPEHTRACLAGCSLGGSFLKIGGVYVGFCLELHAPCGRIVTSPVRTIRVLEPLQV